MKPLMDKHALAEMLDVEVSWVERATSARELPITWVGRYARYDEDDIEAWLAEHKEPPVGTRPALQLAGPRPSTPPPAPKPPAGPAKPHPPAGPRQLPGRAA
jgi:hypothetical protein